jgi:2-haloacid dehalogenase
MSASEDPVRWATFDCFGTLVDWDHGVRHAAELVAPGRGDQLVEAYHRVEPPIQRRRPVPRYREVLTEGLRQAAAELGLELAPDDHDVLAHTIPYWPVFPDVRPALGELRTRGWRLALLTNCDRDIVAQTQRRIGVHVDAVVTVEDAGSYKPAHGHFERFAASFGVRAPHWVHVAQSHFHDVVPASQLGLPCVWINRHGEQHDASLAAAVLPDLTGLADALDRVYGERAG